MGDAEAHWNLSWLFRNGEGVKKDKTLEMYHLEEAAIAGNPFARTLFESREWECGRFDRAVRHWIIAANLGDDKSLQRLKESYKDGHVSKEDFAAALRGYQAAVDATKSPQREEAAKGLEIGRTMIEQSAIGSLPLIWETIRHYYN